MQTFPIVQVMQFDQLPPATLFIITEDGISYYALKTIPIEGRASFVSLGPVFGNANQSFLMAWKPLKVASLGRDFSLLLSTAPSDWTESRPTHSSIGVAVAGTSAFICTNGAHSPQQYRACFVDFGTGEVHERSLPNPAVHVRSWSIVVPGPNNLSMTLLNYPLPGSPD